MESIGQSAGKIVRSFVFEKLTPELAYVIGVYLGDGNVYADQHQLRFQMCSIDKEFPEYVKQCIETFLPSLPEIRQSFFKNVKSPVYVLCFDSTPFGNWLLKVTGCKGWIPREIPREKNILTRHFLEGFLDSDGFVRMNNDKRKNEKHRFEAGFGSVYPWVYEFAHLMRLQGVNVRGPWKFQTRGHKVYVDYRVTVKTLIESGFQFHIKRKQQVLEEYKREQLTIPSETVR